MKKAVIYTILLSVFSMPLQAEPEGIISGDQLMVEAEKVTRSITTDELLKMLQGDPEMVLIDIRTHNEVNRMGGTIDAPQNKIIPRGWLEFRTPRFALEKDTPIVVYCGAGYRSPLAAKTLQDMGYTNVMHYPEGYLGWSKAGNPVKKD